MLLEFLHVLILHQNALLMVVLRVIVDVIHVITNQVVVEYLILQQALLYSTIN